MTRVREATERAVEEMGLATWLLAATDGGQTPDRLSKPEGHDICPLSLLQAKIVFFDGDHRQPGRSPILSASTNRSSERKFGI